MFAPRISILLLTKNAAITIGAVLKKIFSQSGASADEVIAIDSGSTDGTLHLLGGFPIRLEQIPAESFHHARTRNVAAGLASGDILVFLSQDAVPASDRWLATMISNFRDPQVGAVYGRQIPKRGSSLERQDALDTIYGEKRIVKDPACRNGLGYKFYHFSDVNAAIRRDVWKRTRFPEELKVFEDLGIAKRILDGGWKIVYEPDACVFHSHHHTTVGLFRRYFDIGYTLKHLQIWNAPGSRSSLLRDGKQLLAKKLQRVRGNKDDKDHDKNVRAGAALAQDIAKATGLLLGLNHGCIPSKLKKHLSAHQIFQ
jgi:rhamnosyltransferase